MSRSAALLEWLRKTVADRGLAVGSLAASSGIERKRLRRILGGSEDMTVDELLAVTEALELTPAELGMADLEPAAPKLEMATNEPAGARVDPWGNQPRQLFEVAFALGCDFSFLADTSALQDSGIPGAVLARFEGGPLLIKLDAAYHKYNKPRYTDRDVTLTLSFDALYDCTFAWHAISQVAFFPVPQDPPSEDEEDEPVDDTPSGRPTLRLVT
ncbi:MAG: hypothetical protein EP330_29250 [Deltaproteobacteria bacterium]|nr:MAG: hypothetical protein EP330_29250 [Deltaproteobacteria bacterium]